MSSSALRILFVPGIRPKPPAADHAAQLKKCMEFSFLRAGGQVADAARLLAAFELIAWSHDFYGEHKPIDDDLAGIERLLKCADTDEAVLLQARSFGRRLTGWLYALADYFPLLGTRFSTRRMQTRVQEIQHYFADVSGDATSARAKLAKALRDAWSQNQQVLLIGHSFGSVIAYDTLWELSQGEDCGRVDTFMTMGSPLTMNFINHNLQGAHSRGAARYPDCIGRWINLAAVGEVTALDRLLSNRFAPMLRHGLVDSIEDDLALISRFREPNGTFNVHKCYGYMASTEFGRLLVEWQDAIVSTGSTGNRRD